MKSLVNKAIGMVENYFNRQGQLGDWRRASDFDRMTDGMHGGEMIVIAARPSMGKNVIGHEHRRECGVESAVAGGRVQSGNDFESLVLRMLCSNARVNLRNIREGFMSESDFPKLTSSAGKMSSCPLYIDDTPGLSILQLRTRRGAMAAARDQLFVIDYLQLLNLYFAASAGKPAAGNWKFPAALRR